MTKKEVTVVLMAISFYLLPGFGVVGQDLDKIKPKRVIKPSGWEIPGLSESHPVNPRHSPPPGYGVQGVPLQITLLKPTREVRSTVSLYGLEDSAQTITVYQRAAAVRAIIKCEINERVFLYIVQFGVLGYDESSKTTGQSGIFGLLYYDDDGDGIFETRESGAIAVSPSLRIPNWVQKP